MHFFISADVFASKIILYGENHRSPKDKIIIKTFINLGNQEKVYVALEGSPYGPLNPSQTVYGIENSLPFITSVAVKSYVMLYRSLHRLYGEEGYLIENLSEFITMFIDQDPVVIQIWRTIPRPFKSSIDEELALLIDKILIVDELNSIINKHTLDGKAFFRIVNHHTRSFMNIAKSFAVAVGKHLEGVETLDVSPLYDLLQNPHDILERPFLLKR